MTQMKILKFGGSSVATPERICQVVDIVQRACQKTQVAVVVSAFGGVTDALLDAARLASLRDEAYLSIFEKLAQRHLDAATELAKGDEVDVLRARVEGTLSDLRDLLHGVYLLREVSPRSRDSIASHGERLSAIVVAAALRDAGIEAADADARELIRTDARFGQAHVDFAESDELIQRFFAAVGMSVQVVTGFIAATADGETTTLGRGGSDYTAAILGAALDSAAVELWTDVDGVMSADPRWVPEAAPIAAMSYEELMELSHFGAKVVHPPSVQPTRQRSIPLLIKNTFHPLAKGTRVRDGVTSEGPPVRGITAIANVVLLRLEGAGMVGVPGIASRLFGALSRHQVNVILISQASSEHSICWAVAPESVADAVRGVAEEFALEQRVGLIDDLAIEPDLAIVAVVGGGMRRHPGTAGRLFATLGAHGINVRAIAQGSSELNISVVVATADAQRAVGAIHDAFLFPHRRRVQLFLAGLGRVGGAFVIQLLARQEALRAERGLELELVAVAGSRGTLALDGRVSSGEDLAERLRTAADPTSFEVAIEAFATSPRPHKVFIDCTASDATTTAYDRLRASGTAVVTANKRRLAGPFGDYRQLMVSRPGRLYYETTAGAGLPIIGTLKALLATGDRLNRLEGSLSGTLGYLVDQLADGVRFSQAVQRAHQLGYTEPDPRDDLSGLDVARKLLILGRLAGHELELEDVVVEPWLDNGWNELSADVFWDRLPELDDRFVARQAAAVAGGRRLVYLASLDRTGARVCLSDVPAEHPCAGVRGSDNLIALFTDRYRETPLIVRGPGAGPEVTAAGVFADVLQAVAEADLPFGGHGWKF